MKIIFLDVDGVLNSLDYYKRQMGKTGSYKRKRYLKSRKKLSYEDRKALEIDKRAVRNLNNIVKHSCAKVVISSAWRIFGEDNMRKYLNERGFKGEIIGMTTTEQLGERGDQIQKWLDDNSNLDIENFIIIDDSCDMAHLGYKLVRTFSYRGLTKEKAIDAMGMLDYNYIKEVK